MTREADIDVAIVGAGISGISMAAHLQTMCPGTGFTLFEYHPDGGIDWEAGFRASYYLTKSTRLALSANYERLHDSVALSPIVKDDYVLGYFGGVAWQF